MRMKKRILILAIVVTCFTGCATIHEMSAPKDQASAQMRKGKKQKQYDKLASETSAWLGEPVTIQSVNKGFISTDFIAVTKRGKKISCYYTGYFGWKISSIICGGRGNALLDAASGR
jgi:uncharacterized protein YceK